MAQWIFAMYNTILALPTMSTHYEAVKTINCTFLTYSVNVKSIKLLGHSATCH